MLQVNIAEMKQIVHTFLQENKETGMMEEKDREDMQMKVCFIIMRFAHYKITFCLFNYLSWDTGTKKMLER